MSLNCIFLVHVVLENVWSVNSVKESIEWESLCDKGVPVSLETLKAFFNNKRPCSSGRKYVKTNCRRVTPTPF